MIEDTHMNLQPRKAQMGSYELCKESDDKQQEGQTSQSAVHQLPYPDVETSYTTVHVYSITNNYHEEYGNC